MSPVAINSFICYSISKLAKFSTVKSDVKPISVVYGVYFTLKTCTENTAIHLAFVCVDHILGSIHLFSMVTRSANTWIDGYKQQ